MTHTKRCFVIFTEKGEPMRSGISFNSEDEAWRMYFSNRSSWKHNRNFAIERGYSCRVSKLVTESPQQATRKDGGK